MYQEKGGSRDENGEQVLWDKDVISLYGFISLWRPHVFLQGNWCQV